MCAEGYEGDLCNTCSHGYQEAEDQPGCTQCHNNCGDEVGFALAIVIAALIMIVLCSGYFIAFRRGWLCFKRPDVLLPPKPQPTGLVPDPEAVFLNPPAPPPKSGKKEGPQSIGKAAPKPPGPPPMPTQTAPPRYPPPAPPPAESRSIPPSRAASQAGQYSVAGSRPGTAASAMPPVLGQQMQPPPPGAQPPRPQSAMSNASRLSTGSTISSTSSSSVILQLSQTGQQLPPLVYKKAKSKASVRRAEREAQRQAQRQELGIGASAMDDGASDSGSEVSRTEPA